MLNLDTFQHSKEEWNFFDKVPDAKQRWNYKKTLCTHFSQKSCMKRERYLCPFAHGESDARCYLCDTKSGAVGHYQLNCPQNPELRLNAQ